MCGQNCTFVVRVNGTVLACGEGSYGRLGQGNSDDLQTLTPIGALSGISSVLSIHFFINIIFIMKIAAAFVMKREFEQACFVIKFSHSLFQAAIFHGKNLPNINRLRTLVSLCKHNVYAML